jgi:hypothetical protein
MSSKKKSTVTNEIISDAEAVKQKKHLAKCANNPAFMNGCAAKAYLNTVIKGIELADLVEDFSKEIKAIDAGDLSSLAAMLTGQAYALQSMFVSLARRAERTEYLSQYQVFANMALKAQAQSRATIQALADLKQPKQVIVAQQANISQGHQQVNNNEGKEAKVYDIHSENSEIVKNELLKKERHEQEQWLDRRTQEATSEKDSRMATMEIFDRSKNT